MAAVPIAVALTVQPNRRGAGFRDAARLVGFLPPVREALDPIPRLPNHLNWVWWYMLKSPSILE